MNVHDVRPEPSRHPQTNPEPGHRTHRVFIHPWTDPVIDRTGFDPRAAYVEHYWLPVIGPTATWVVRRFADRFDAEPEGFRVDLDHLAAAMGLSYAKGPSSPLGRSLQRLVMFGLAHTRSDGFAVRRRFPPVAMRHLRRLPADMQAAHHARATPSPDSRPAA